MFYLFYNLQEFNDFQFWRPALPDVSELVQQFGLPYIPRTENAPQHLVENNCDGILFPGTSVLLDSFHQTASLSENIDLEQTLDISRFQEGFANCILNNSSSLHSTLKPSDLVKDGNTPSNKHFSSCFGHNLLTGKELQNRYNISPICSGKLLFAKKERPLNNTSGYTQ